jgi:hypothetical protein
MKSESDNTTPLRLREKPRPLYPLTPCRAKVRRRRLNTQLSTPQPQEQHQKQKMVQKMYRKVQFCGSCYRLHQIFCAPPPVLVPKSAEKCRKVRFWHPRRSKLLRALTSSARINFPKPTFGNSPFLVRFGAVFGILQLFCFLEFISSKSKILCALRVRRETPHEFTLVPFGAIRCRSVPFDRNVTTFSSRRSFASTFRKTRIWYSKVLKVTQKYSQVLCASPTTRNRKRGHVRSRSVTFGHVWSRLVMPPPTSTLTLGFSVRKRCGLVPQDYFSQKTKIGNKK